MDEASIAEAAPLESHDRLTRLEARFDMHLSVEARRDEEEALRRRDEAKRRRRSDAHAVRERSELALSMQTLIARLDKFETAILGDEAMGRKSLGERLDGLERAVLSARMGWRAASIIGTAILTLLSWFAVLLHWPTLGGHPP